MTEDKLVGPLDGIIASMEYMLVGVVAPLSLLLLLMLVAVLLYKAESNDADMRIERKRTKKIDWDAKVAPHNEDLLPCQCGPLIRLLFW